MTISKIMWLGLRTDREKTIYAEAFWEGVNSTVLMRKDMGLLEKELIIGRGHAKEIQRTKTKTSKGNAMARWWQDQD